MKFLAVLIFLVLNVSFANSDQWIIDKDHSLVEFKVDHLLLSEVRGRFDQFSGDIKFDLSRLNNEEAVSKFMFRAEVITGSISTGVVKRDNHLKSPDFFNTTIENNRKISFVSKSVKTHNGKRFEVDGDLTIKGITKPVLIVFNFEGQADAYNQKKIFFKGKFEINREDFGLAWNDGKVKSMSPTGKVLESFGAIGKTVKITLVLQATQKIK